MDKMLLTVSQASEVLGIGRTKLYELLRSDPRLQPVHIGRAIRIPTAVLDAWIQEQIAEQNREEVLDNS